MCMICATIARARLRAGLPVAAAACRTQPAQQLADQKSGAGVRPAPGAVLAPATYRPAAAQACPA